MGIISGFFTTVPIDWFILGFIGLGIALDSVRTGIGRACALSLALPLAGVFSSFFAKAALISSLGATVNSATGQAIIFGILALASYLLVRRMGLEYIDSGMGEPIQSLLAGAATAIVVAVVWLSTPGLVPLFHIGPQVGAIFAESYRLWWLLAAYLALAFARG